MTTPAALPSLPEPHWAKNQAFSADQMREYARAALAATPEPAGWRLVPVEPTEAMLRAGSCGVFNHASTSGATPDDAHLVQAKAAWAAMLAAAPVAMQPLEGHPQCHRCHGNSRTHRTDCPLFPEQEAVRPIEGVSAKNLRKAVPAEFWSLLHEWSESTNDERIDWIEHRFGELFALSKAVQPDPVQPIDERAAFEADLHKSRAEERGEWPSEAFEQTGDGRYVWQSMQHRWESWQARAALSAVAVQPTEGVSDALVAQVHQFRKVLRHLDHGTWDGESIPQMQRDVDAALDAGPPPAQGEQ